MEFAARVCLMFPGCLLAPGLFREPMQSPRKWHFAALHAHCLRAGALSSHIITLKHATCRAAGVTEYGMRFVGRANVSGGCWGRCCGCFRGVHRGTLYFSFVRISNQSYSFRKNYIFLDSLSVAFTFCHFYLTNWLIINKINKRKWLQYHGSMKGSRA